VALTEGGNEDLSMTAKTKPPARWGTAKACRVGDIFVIDDGDRKYRVGPIRDIPPKLWDQAVRTMMSKAGRQLGRTIEYDQKLSDELEEMLKEEWNLLLGMLAIERSTKTKRGRR
jgi:hypothetical protein